MPDHKQLEEEKDDFTVQLTVFDKETRQDQEPHSEAMEGCCSLTCAPGLAQPAFL